MWAIKTQADFNFPYLIMKYLYDCLLRKDIGHLPYGMILKPFFQKAKIKVNEEIQIIMPNATIMITLSNLHKMHLTFRGNRCWVKAHITLTPSIPPTIEEASTTQTSVGAPANMIVVQSLAFLLEEMCKLHFHLIDRLTA